MSGGRVVTGSAYLTQNYRGFPIFFCATIDEFCALREGDPEMAMWNGSTEIVLLLFYILHSSFYIKYKVGRCASG
jgi:hypothetical protein